MGLIELTGAGWGGEKLTKKDYQGICCVGGWEKRASGSGLAFEGWGFREPQNLPDQLKLQNFPWPFIL